MQSFSQLKANGHFFQGGLAGRAIRGECPKAQQHEVKKSSNSEYGDLHNAFMKELKLKLWICYKFAAFLNTSAQ